MSVFAANPTLRSSGPERLTLLMLQQLRIRVS